MANFEFSLGLVLVCELTLISELRCQLYAVSYIFHVSLGANLLIDDAKGSIRLSDFGIAKDLQVCYMKTLDIDFSNCVNLCLPFAHGIKIRI